MDPSEIDWKALGGWPAAARLLFTRVSDQFALVLVDTNSDGRELCLDCLALDGSGRWHVIATGTDVSPTGYAGWTPEFVYAWGQAEPGHAIRVGYRGQVISVRAGDDGWWAFLGATDPTAGDLVEPELLG